MIHGHTWDTDRFGKLFAADFPPYLRDDVPEPWDPPEIRG